jgi:hypothetical protein
VKVFATVLRFMRNLLFGLIDPGGRFQSSSPGTNKESGAEGYSVREESLK